MVLGFIGAWFGRQDRLPADQVTRIPRRVKKRAATAIAGMKAALDELGGLGGIADVRENKRMPRGFSGLMQTFYRHVDEFHAAAREQMGLGDAHRPGTPGGCQSCHAAPMGVHAVESLNIYRTVRGWKDFPVIARRLGELAEQQFKDIQSNHSGKDPEKIRAGGRAVRRGRLAFARRAEPCPFLDPQKQRCRIWDQRPLVCRMQHATTPPQWSSPSDEHYPAQVRSINVRPPVGVQVALAQLDKRMGLQHSPFLYAGVAQALELTGGHGLTEVGEAPMRVQQDGVMTARANRNVKHAKKFQKKPKGSRPKKKR